MKLRARMGFSLRSKDIFIMLLIPALFTGCAIGSSQDVSQNRGLTRDKEAQSLVSNIRAQVEGELLQNLGPHYAEVIQGLSQPAPVPALYKQTPIIKALQDPWVGMQEFERRGIELVTLLHSNRPLPPMVKVLEQGFRRQVEMIAVPLPPESLRFEDHFRFIGDVLKQSQRLRHEALNKVSQADQQFVYQFAPKLVSTFFPQSEARSGPDLVYAQDEKRFAQVIETRLDYPKLVASAQVLAALADAEWLVNVGKIFQSRQVPPRKLPSVEGDILNIRDTPYGFIVIGGAGSNRYTLDGTIALVIDVGGDDLYEGKIAASDSTYGNRMVIDLSGKDTYRGSELGLATGRLGVGILVDLLGDDQYQMAEGSGGAGFGGVGLLFDQAGNDHYHGHKMTQGVAIGGLGLLVDAAGNDDYSSAGYAMGFGGPLGVGALVDGQGNDSYQCGNTFPSVYNKQDVPSGDTDSPLYQYDGFCLGFGTGKRMFTKGRVHTDLNLAGGWGLVVDGAGNDRYTSSNFSQGAGYFFGAGLNMDLGGNDVHQAARYGHGSAAHAGVGLFVEQNGHDRYISTGPVFNAGTAWDRSVALCIDVGMGDDLYDFSQSDGLGRAVGQSWSLFVDEGGSDHYRAPRGFGMASQHSVSAFFDLQGVDQFLSATNNNKLGNGLHFLNDPAGLFVDRVDAHVIEPIATR